MVGIQRFAGLARFLRPDDERDDSRKNGLSCPAAHPVSSEADRCLGGKNITVLILTSIPIHGGSPWSHFDENGRVVWEAGYWCDYNLGLKQLAGAQRTLVEGYAAAGKSVFLMDAWNVYTAHWYTDWMYSGVMHPGPTGADLLAEEWIRVFAQTGEIVRRK
jgi:hypothetical protein